MSVTEAFKSAAAKRILIKDGAFGTAIQRACLSADCYRGEYALNKDQKGNNDLLCLTRPALIRQIAEGYAEAGADVLGTNSFNANRISQADYGAEHLVSDMNVAAARIVREVADEFADSSRARSGRRIRRFRSLRTSTTRPIARSISTSSRRSTVSRRRRCWKAARTSSSLRPSSIR